MAGRTSEFAELRRQLDTADADIVLVNKPLDEAHGMYSPVVNGYYGEHDASIYNML